MSIPDLSELAEIRSKRDEKVAEEEKGEKRETGEGSRIKEKKESKKKVPKEVTSRKSNKLREFLSSTGRTGTTLREEKGSLLPDLGSRKRKEPETLEVSDTSEEEDNQRKANSPEHSVLPIVLGTASLAVLAAGSYYLYQDRFSSRPERWRVQESGVSKMPAVPATSGLGSLGPSLEPPVLSRETERLKAPWEA